MSIYNYTDAGIITLNSDHLTEVVDGKAGMNEVTSFLGMFRHDYVDEFHNIRLGKGVANRKVELLNDQRICNQQMQREQFINVI